MSVSRYPLAWPRQWKRTLAYQRQRADWKKTVTVQPGSVMPGVQVAPRKESRTLSVVDAAMRLERQLELLGAAYITLSTNVELRLDGRPRASQGEPVDPGAALYFQLKGQPHCLACDRWIRVADNINALALHIDATRRIGRYGVGSLEQAFAGYKAIPESVTGWWMVLGVTRETATVREVDRAFKEKARVAHPDAGGTLEAMAKLNTARADALTELQQFGGDPR